MNDYAGGNSSGGKRINISTVIVDVTVSVPESRKGLLRDFARRLADTMVQDAVERCFERVTEAAKKVGDRFDSGHPEAEFPNLREFGSVLRHDYDRVNPVLMWAFTRMSRSALIKLVPINPEPL